VKPNFSCSTSSQQVTIDPARFVVHRACCQKTFENSGGRVMDEKMEEVLLLISGDPNHSDAYYAVSHPFEAAKKIGALFTRQAPSPVQLGALFDQMPSVLGSLAKVSPEAAVQAAKNMFRVCHSHSDMGPLVSRRVREILSPNVVGQALFTSLQKTTLTSHHLKTVVLPKPPIPKCFVHPSAKHPCGCGLGSGR
jgi:hypothetical protein